MENNISNTTTFPRTYGDTGIDGVVKISQTPGGHYDELDDTLGFERRVRSHPNGTSEIWMNDRRDLVVHGDNYKMVIGNDTITVTGTVNINVNGDCNTTVAGDYNLAVKGNMNVSVKGNIVQKCDGTHVTETANGDIIDISGSQLQHHSRGDMLTKCGGVYDCSVVSDYSLNAVTASILSTNFVCATAGVVNITSGISTSICGGAMLNLASGGPISLQSATNINMFSPTALLAIPTITITGVTVGVNFFAGPISLLTHTHLSSAPGSPTSPPITP